MAKVEFTLNRTGVGQILRSKELQDDMDRRGRAVAAAAGPGHESESRKGRTRARARVATTTPAAAARERKTHALVSALDAAAR
jgi:secreted protein with Ig-like and vWFA domain